MKKLTLIGGAPLSGKTTLSQKIAKQDGAVEISTDSIRSWMQQLVSKDKYPDLFYTVGMSAGEFYEKYTTAQSVVDGEIAESKAVEHGIRALLGTKIAWDHLVIEGIALSPGFMRVIEGEFTDREVEPIVLADQDEKRIRERINNRGLWGTKGSYPESLVPREVQWVVLYNHWFVEQAARHGIEVRYN